ncbi:MAG: energy-dependent translational throttle protein EttA [Deltaproteobacteria bacterium]|nr:energy-dependent translational throttle protein EttA [Deltaproteobacteria bacterium]
MNDTKVIYTMMRVNKTYPPKRQVIKDISLSYFYGAKIGVLGLNGSGKSTLLRIMAGVEKDFEGSAHLSDGYSVGYLEQEPALDDKLTVGEVVRQGAHETVKLLAQFEALSAKFETDLSAEEMEKVCEKQAKLMEQLEAIDAWNLDDKLNFAMEALRCPPAERLVSTLSGGERRRVALCRLLIQEPDILLLDEPTNHLDAESVRWLEAHLRDYKGTIIAVTHDRYFLDNVAGWILELDRGHGIPYKGNYSSWLEQKQIRLAQEKKAEDKRIKLLERELEWIRMSPKARHAKGKARINSYDKLLSEESEKLRDDLQLSFPKGPRLGEIVINAKGVSKAYGDKLLFGDLNFVLPPGGIVGVIGPNGAGKTTLFKLICGQEKPDSGEFVVGETVKLGYMEQSRAALDPEKNVWDVISGGAENIKLGAKEINSRAFVARFNFEGSDQQKKIGDLSGGERNRVQLALLFQQNANVILLDEPTNDLDVNTLRALEEALENFPGCAVVISHDRWFLDRVATHILAFEGDSTVCWFDGNFSEYEEDRRKRLGKEADVPHRIRYASIKR